MLQIIGVKSNEMKRSGFQEVQGGSRNQPSGGKPSFVPIETGPAVSQYLQNQTIHGVNSTGNGDEIPADFFGFEKGRDFLAQKIR
jgi:hypothetical protein